MSEKFSFFILTICLGTLTAFAANTGYISKAYIVVKRSANSQAQSIAKLKKGTKVIFVKSQGNWFLIKYKASNGQVRGGWIPRGTLSKTRPNAYASAPPRTYSPPPPVSSPPSSQSSGRYSANASSSSKRTKSKPSYSSGSGNDSKLSVNFGLGASYYTYEVTSDTRDFAYSLLGPSAILNVNYKLWQNSSSDLRAMFVLDGNFTYYVSKTNLLDSSGTQFSTRNKKNMSFNVVPGLRIEKDLNAFSPSLFIGYRYHQFMGDDIVDLSGNPLGLYNSYTATGIVAGLGISKPGERFDVNLNLNAIFMQDYTEEPDGTSGTIDDTITSIGLMPNLLITYKLSDDAGVGLNYGFHRVEAAFEGTAVNRVEQSFDNIKVKTDTHIIGLSYKKHF